MKKGVFKVYSSIKEEKNRNSLYSKDTFLFPKHRNIEIKLNIVSAISKDVNIGMKTCIKDISSIIIRGVKSDE